MLRDPVEQALSWHRQHSQSSPRRPSGVPLLPWLQAPANATGFENFRDIQYAAIGGAGKGSSARAAEAFPADAGS